MRKFMRTRSAESSPPLPAHPPPSAEGPPPAAKTNGHLNGGGVLRQDDRSTLSRYWSEASDGADARLWEDPDFPPTWCSIGDKKLAAGFVWLRPHELSPQPRFRGDVQCDRGLADDALDDEALDQLSDRWSAEPGDLSDGRLGRAASALALTPRLLSRAVPPQSFVRSYRGAFSFRFWVFGSWRDVRVDDRLPVPTRRPLAQRDDYTQPLLEKAYAKLYGSYASVRRAAAEEPADSCARALRHLSGGVVQSFSLALQPRALTLQVLHSAVPRCSLAVASGASPGPHCATGLARVRDAVGGDTALVRVRSALGGDRASDRPAWWRALQPADRELLAARAPRPGERWMTFDEFIRAFGRLELVHLGPDEWLSEPALHGRRPWRAVIARRRWRPGYNAGGPPSCTETTSCNPQFQVRVPGEGKCHVVVSVTQQHEPGESARRLRGIGFAVYELPPKEAARSRRHHLPALRALDVTHESRATEVVTFFTLPGGTYLVVPHTRRPHTDVAFLLRLYTDVAAHVWEVNEDNAIEYEPAADPSAEAPLPAGVRRLLGPDGELDAHGLRGALRRAGTAVLTSRPSLELCRALLPLRDRALCGRVAVSELPALFSLLARWRRAFLAHAAQRCASPARCCAYRLRAALRSAGVLASNKVLECLVLRYGDVRSRDLSLESYVMALARLHLAHDRHRSLETRSKSSPLSLEEMILMTVYS